MASYALFVFNPDPMCFVHVLLNALDMDARGDKARMVMEGGATALVAELAEKDNQLHGLWQKVRQKDLVEGVCRACAGKMNALEAVRREGLELLDEMNGHPSMAAYRQKGYEIITF